MGDELVEVVESECLGEGAGASVDGEVLTSRRGW